MFFIGIRFQFVDTRGVFEVYGKCGVVQSGFEFCSSQKYLLSDGGVERIELQTVLEALDVS